ncbi:MAG: hypothetical protein PHX08_21625 [Lachnospiraceae bacterium]|nr:hypothetical protein [Lachnospiraceae bacterium]
MNVKKILTISCVVAIATVMASLSMILPVENNSVSGEVNCEYTYEELGITQEEMTTALDSIDYNSVVLTTDENGNIITNETNTLDNGRFGVDVLGLTVFRIYLDSYSVNLLISGSGTVVGAAVGAAIGGIAGAAVGGIVGTVLGATISEFGIDYSNGIIVDVELKNAVVIFNVLIAPGIPTITDVRSQ